MSKGLNLEQDIKTTTTGLMIIQVRVAVTFKQHKSKLDKPDSVNLAQVTKVAVEDKSSAFLTE